MKIEQITEVGIAVIDLEKATKMFVDLFGGTAGEVIEMDMYHMRYCMCRLGGIDFELMEPTGDEGVIADFIKTRGQGLHHVAFGVDGLEEGMGFLKGQGVKFVGEAPIGMRMHGADMTGKNVSGEAKFTFSIPASTLGVLFEFIEYPGGYEFSGE